MSICPPKPLPSSRVAEQDRQFQQCGMKTCYTCMTFTYVCPRETDVPHATVKENPGGGGGIHTQRGGLSQEKRNGTRLCCKMLLPTWVFKKRSLTHVAHGGQAHVTPSHPTPLGGPESACSERGFAACPTHRLSFRGAFGFGEGSGAELGFSKAFPSLGSLLASLPLATCRSRHPALRITVQRACCSLKNT